MAVTRRTPPSPTKAQEMLHNPPHGQPLSDKQRKFFGLLASGKKPTRPTPRP
jgi:hypothetical protein